MVLYYPYIAILKNDEGIKGKEFVKKYPEYKWIQRFFLPLYILWIILSNSIMIYGFLNLDQLQWFFSTGNIITFMGAFIGFFALLTGVLVTPYGIFSKYFTGSKAFQVAKTHVLICMGVITINSIIQFILTR